jgi:hypothetical protein
MQWTSTFGASAAASDRVSPSTAPLAIAIDAWPVKPCVAATVENKRTEAGATPRELLMPARLSAELALLREQPEISDEIRLRELG